MTEVNRILDQLSRAFEGEAWHGPAVLEILQGTTPQQAATRPLDSAHTIWETALHIAAWLRACRRRLEGDRAQLTEAEDWPVVTTNVDVEGWQEVIVGMKQALDELRSAIAQLDDSRLDQPIIDGMSSVYVTLHGVIQHSLYHAGQMAILKKI
jgi:uncharacterized damage-inducible protein DinB